MATSEKHAHHAIDYVEIPVVDMTAAQTFYAAAFGWRFTDYGPGYAGIQGEEKEQGGLARVDDVPQGGGPLVVLFSNDLAATHRAVEIAGGAITTPPFDFPGGRRFHFSDPSGNAMAVWEKS